GRALRAGRGRSTGTGLRVPALSLVEAPRGARRGGCRRSRGGAAGPGALLRRLVRRLAAHLRAVARGQLARRRWPRVLGFGAGTPENRGACTVRLRARPGTVLTVPPPVGLRA